MNIRIKGVAQAPPFHMEQMRKISLRPAVETVGRAFCFGTEKGELVKRYPYIVRAVQEGQTRAVFYVGKRKHEILITEVVKTVCRIFDDIYSSTKNKWIRLMIEGVRAGKSDISLIHVLPWERNAIYERKRKLIEKIYNCCVSLQLVCYDEILKEEIA